MLKDIKMRAYQFVIFFLGIFITTPIMGQARFNLNNEASSEFQAADVEMNQVYKEILLLYKDNAQFITNLRSAQRAWLKFRDAELEAHYPATSHENRRHLYGSFFPMCFANSKAVLTRSRTEQLRVWIKGVEEGEVCAGSVKLDRDLENGK